MDRAGGHPAAGAPGDTPRVTPQIAAEAAAWVARLHGPERTRQTELACLAWQARSAAHRHAFERCTETWMEVPNAARAIGLTGALDTRRPPGGDPLEDAPDGGAGGAAGHGDAPDDGAGHPPWQDRRRLVLATLAVAAVVGAGSLGWQALDRGDRYLTEVGESQTVVLADGTRISLNTDTRLRVDYGPARRQVEVSRGEAVFEVARDAARPFVVRAGASEVVALGTVFAVRLRLPPDGAAPGAAAALEVTLVEGRVAVRPLGQGEGGGAAGAAPAQPLLMQPGERVRLAAEAGAVAEPRLDRPRLEQLLAWQRSEAVFDGATLAEAVAEMNRYSRTPLVLAGDLAGSDQRVSGQFRTGDNAAFAQALALLHGLSVHERPGRLELSRQP